MSRDPSDFAQLRRCRRSANGICSMVRKPASHPYDVDAEAPATHGPCRDANTRAWTGCKTRNRKVDGTSLGVLRPFGVSQLGQSSRTGLPLRYRPLSRFFTLSAVFSCPSLATLFRVASAHRILGLQSFSRSASRCTSRCSLLFCCFAQLRFGRVSPSSLCPSVFTACRASPSNVIRSANTPCASTRVATSSPLRRAEAHRSGASGHVACRGWCTETRRAVQRPVGSPTEQ